MPRARTGSARRDVHDVVERHDFGRASFPPDPRQHQDVADESLHLLDGGADSTEVVAAVFAEPLRTLHLQERRHALQADERRLEVVRHRVGKAIELLVPCLQRVRLLAQMVVEPRVLDRDRRVTGE
jgi:hypothetical protein